MPNTLIDFLRKEVVTNWRSMSELARQAGVSPALMSEVLSEKQPASIGFCVKVARAIREPPEMLLRMAGLSPPGIDELRATDAELDRACQTVAELPEADRAFIFRIVAALSQERMASSTAREFKQFLSGIHQLTDDEFAEIQEEFRQAVQKRGREEDAPETGVEFRET